MLVVTLFIDSLLKKKSVQRTRSFPFASKKHENFKKIPVKYIYLLLNEIGVIKPQMKFNVIGQHIFIFSIIFPRNARVEIILILSSRKTKCIIEIISLVENYTDI